MPIIDSDYMIEPGLSPEMVEATARAQVADTIAHHTLSAKDAPFFFEAEGRQFVSVPSGWGEAAVVDVTLPAQPMAVTFRSTLRTEDLTATALEAARAALEGDHPEWTPGWRSHLKRGIEELAAALACAPA